MELSGDVVPAGSSVGVAVGAANRDPKALNEPDMGSGVKNAYGSGLDLLLF